MFIFKLRFGGRVCRRVGGLVAVAGGRQLGKGVRTTERRGGGMGSPPFLLVELGEPFGAKKRPLGDGRKAV